MVLTWARRLSLPAFFYLPLNFTVPLNFISSTPSTSFKAVEDENHLFDIGLTVMVSSLATLALCACPS